VSHYMQHDWRAELEHRMGGREMERYRLWRLQEAAKLERQREERKNGKVQS